MAKNNNISSDPTVLKRLKGYFGIEASSNAQDPVDKIKLYKQVKGDTDSKGNYNYTLEKEKFPDNVQDLWRYYISSCHDDFNSWETMSSVYDDMDILVMNCAPIAKAVEIIVDEVLQADANNQTIFVEGNRKIRKYIEQFFQDINLYEHLRSTVKDIVKYGNAIWVLGFDNKGVNEIVQVDPRMLRERMEFSPFELNNKINNQDNLITNYMKSVNRVEDLVDMILNKENSISYFKTYLIGYEIEDAVLPPWKVLHFRNITSDSAFKPYGVPMYIHAMSAYRRYDAAMSLAVTARGAAFPKQVYKVKLPNVVSPTEKFAKATEFMNQMLNNGFGTSKKELPGLGDIIVTIDELYDYETQKAEIELGNTDDIEILRDEILDATLLPRKLIDPRDSGFGDSGVALSEQFKPFARLVYRFQSILLANLTELVKIHLLHTGDFSLDEIEFSLNMPYPESQTNNDVISSQNSLLDLANNIISAIEDKITGGEKLPTDLIKTIYNKFLPYDSNIVDFWIDEAVKAKEAGDTTPTEDSRDGDYFADEDFDYDEAKNESESEESVPTPEEDITSDNPVITIPESVFIHKRKWRMLEKEVGKFKLKEMIDDIIFKEKHKILREGSLKGLHYFSSKNKSNSFDIVKFEKLCQKKDTKLVEKLIKEEERSNLYEEYIFNLGEIKESK